jgi:hypothetical protein
LAVPGVSIDGKKLMSQSFFENERSRKLIQNMRERCIIIVFFISTGGGG